MTTRLADLTKSEWRRFTSCPVNCSKLRFKISSLSDYLAIVSDAIRTEDPFWFRGHENVSFTLTPSALRFTNYSDRVKALALMADFKRVADLKLRRPPTQDKDFEWALIAQHNGLPTRLLDWSESATTALYFACLKETSDGVVYMLNPIDLNRLSYPAKPRVLDPQQDSTVILKYLRMGAGRRATGLKPVAVYPVWNSERLIMQKGVFTLHGAQFDLDSGKISSLTAIPILREMKPVLRAQLQRIGVDEMTLFPELEHSCAHLKRRAGLER